MIIHMGSQQQRELDLNLFLTCHFNNLANDLAHFSYKETNKNYTKGSAQMNETCRYGLVPVQDFKFSLIIQYKAKNYNF